MIPNISEGIHDINSIVQNSGIDIDTLKAILKIMEFENISKLEKNIVSFDKSSKIHTSVLAIKLGSNIDSVSKVLHWKDFEEFTSLIAEYNGYKVHTNVRLRKPKKEIDLLAIKNDEGLSIDCKHWNHSLGEVNLKKIVKAQITRTREFIKYQGREHISISHIIPVIVTLYCEEAIFVNDVPIVPINKFQSFLNELDIIRNKIIKIFS